MGITIEEMQDVLNYYDKYRKELYDMEFNEKDNENQEPLKSFAKTEEEEKTRVLQKKRPRGTINGCLFFKCENYFGRLKDLTQLGCVFEYL